MASIGIALQHFLGIEMKMRLIWKFLQLSKIMIVDIVEFANFNLVLISE